MAIDVQEATYYHINSTANLSPHDLLRRGQVYEVGKESNPFFRLYETWQRTYNVDDTPVGAIRFLWRIKNNTIRLHDPDTLRNTAHEVGNHFMMLARELLWENVRLTEFPAEPSRQKCMFLAATLEDIRAWFDYLNMAECWVVKLTCTGRALHVDSRLLAEDGEPLPVWYENARRYWRGEMSENPRREVLFEGVLRVEEIFSPEEFKKA